MGTFVQALPPTGQQVPALTVTQLVRRVRSSLEEAVPQCWVVGEVSNARRSTSGHLYFTLKDAHSAINVVMFKAAAERLRFKLEDGLEVLVLGRVSIFEPRGTLQLYVEVVEPRGVGALQIAFEQLKRKLEQQGFFRAERKRPLPFFPRAVGIVTATSGGIGGAGSAALNDMLKIIFSRNPNAHVIISPSKVQGEGAAAEIAAALDALNEYGRVDVIIVGRGGGSLEDLWPFNEEVVAQAIFRSRIPVVSAVGHEVDYTIADLVADCRAPTPTAAAQMVMPSKAELQAQIARLQAMLTRAIQDKIADARNDLLELERRLGDPRVLVRDARQSVDEQAQDLIVALRRTAQTYRQRLEAASLRLKPPLGSVREARLKLSRALVVLGGSLNTCVQGRRLLLDRLSVALRENCKRGIERFRLRFRPVAQRLEEASKAAVARNRLRMAELCSRLDSLSPLRVLERGYAVVVQKRTGTALIDAAHVRPGDLLDIRLHRGMLRAKTLAVTLRRREESGPNGQTAKADAGTPLEDRLKQQSEERAKV